MRISDWSADVCSSDLPAGRGGTGRQRSAHRSCRPAHRGGGPAPTAAGGGTAHAGRRLCCRDRQPVPGGADRDIGRSEEHTSELQSLMRTSYAVFCLKKKKNKNQYILHDTKKD